MKTTIIPVLPAECPICHSQEFKTGITGWDKHVGALQKHPKWHPELTRSKERLAAFRAEFPTFFEGALTPSVRVQRPKSVVAEAVDARGGSHNSSHCPTCGAPVEIRYVAKT